jgi:quinohemoprotein ethanol dehydrogenase
LAPNGMASFARFIDAKGAEDLRAYVLSEARGAATPPADGARGPGPKS